MILAMGSFGCSCCRRDVQPAAVLQKRRSQPVGPGAGPAVAYSLCGECADWLAQVISKARSPVAAPGALVGTPMASGRGLIFDNQCRVCRLVVHGQPAAFQCAADERRSWSLSCVCGACAAWIDGLASDGRSARGVATRSVDGPYGEWPHPDLRQLRVELAIDEPGALALVRETCEAMGVAWCMGGKRPLADVLFIEATAPRGRGRLPAGQARVVLAHFEARKALLSSLDRRTVAWLTIPVTPHQVAGALARVVRYPGLRVSWDGETGLPIVTLQEGGAAVLAVEPRAGVDRFEVAWLLRRFARGYDDVALAGGRIIVIPKAPPGRLKAVALRLERLLDGRCDVAVLRASPRRRFDAAG